MRQFRPEEGQANILVGDTVVETAARGAMLGEMIDVAHFDLLVQETPAFSRYVMGAMAERMRRMNDNLRAAQTVKGARLDQYVALHGGRRDACAGQFGRNGSWGTPAALKR